MGAASPRGDGGGVGSGKGGGGERERTVAGRRNIEPRAGGGKGLPWEPYGCRGDAGRRPVRVRAVHRGTECAYGGRRRARDGTAPLPCSASAGHAAGCPPGGRHGR